MGLLALVLILTVIFTLKLTGVIKKEEYKLEDNILESQNVVNDDIKETNLVTRKIVGSSINLFIIIGVMISIIVLIGCYKAYVKLGISSILLKIGYFIGPVVTYLLNISIVFTFGLSPILNIIMYIINIIYVIAIIAIQVCYFKCLGMSGAIPLLIIIPSILQLIGIPYASVLILIMFIIYLVYSVIASIKMAEFFNRNKLFALGLIFLPFIFLPILGYSKD